jgi:hypothetical protein
MDRRSFLLATLRCSQRDAFRLAARPGRRACADLSRRRSLGYHCSDGYRVPVVWTETHEVIAVDATGIAVRVTGRGASTSSASRSCRRQAWSRSARLTTRTRRAPSIRR